jgi:hypothetical protein
MGACRAAGRALRIVAPFVARLRPLTPTRRHTPPRRVTNDAGRSPRTRVREGYSAHFDDTLILEISVAPLGPGEKRPAKAIANIAIARIEPKTAFALSHLPHSR